MRVVRSPTERPSDRSHNRLDGMHNASVRLNSGNPDQKPDAGGRAGGRAARPGGSEMSRAKFMQGGMWEDPLRRERGGNAAMSNFWSGPPFRLRPNFEARSSKRLPSIHPLPSPLSLSSFAHSNMYPSTHAHALATLPHSPLSSPCGRPRPPCPALAQYERGT